MQSGALKALEFDRIVEAVCRLAQTPPGASRLAPSAAADRAGAVASARWRRRPRRRASSSGTGEIALARAGGARRDRSTAWRSKGARSSRCTSSALATFLASVDATVTGIRRARAAFPRLGAIVETAGVVRARDRRRPPQDRSVRRGRGRCEPGAAGACAIGCASSGRGCAARSSRTCAARTRRSTCSSRSSPIATAATCSSSAPSTARRFPGIVHGSSGSGASLFLEPLSTVEINNDIVALEQQEHEEVHRILLALADAFRRRAGGAAPHDGRGDGARRGAGQGAVLAEPSAACCRRSRPTAGSSCARARHPLLIARGIEVTPVDVILIPPARVLVITGPNTGGKTVALKTAGLLPIMAQAGLLIPAADGTQVPIFHSVFADIGDEQSIADKPQHVLRRTSPTSSRWTRRWRCRRSCCSTRPAPAPIPNEGGALAMAIIDHFRRRGAMVVATTHFDALKTYASTTEGVTSAGFGFNPRDVRADLSAALRIAGQQPGARDRDAARPAGRASSSRRARSGPSARAQLAEHLAKVERERAGARARAPAGRARASDGRRRRGAGCRGASRSCATARRRSGSGSTSGSTSGCATRGARSTRSSTR